MMIFLYFIIGLLASFIPIYLTSLTIGYNDLELVDYKNIVMYIPLFFGIFMVFYMNIIEYMLKIKNYYIIGIIFGIIMSSIARFILDTPNVIFNMNDSNMFQVYAIMVWSLFFGTIVKSILIY